LTAFQILSKADISEDGEGWRGGLRGGVEPQATRGTSGVADFRRREGSQTNCLGLFRAAQGTRTPDLAVVGRQSRGTQPRRSYQSQHDGPG